MSGRCRDVSDDQAIAVGTRRARARAPATIPLEQALANDFAAAIECAAPVAGRSSASAPTARSSSSCAARRSSACRRRCITSPRAEWIALTRAVRDACEAVARSTSRPASSSRSPAWTGWSTVPGAFEIGGPEGDNGLSGKKLVAQAYGTAVPIGGGATFGKDPRKVDPRGQRMAREMALDLVTSGQAREATVWLAWRPGDVEPRWVEVKTVAAYR